MPIVNSPNLEQASIYSDINSLDHIRRQGQVDQTGAIKKAAKEFEAFFMNMMLKSMRQASEVIGSDSPLFSQQEKMYTAMLDEQLSVDLSQGGHLKIADLMVEQLTRQNSKAAGTFDTDYHLNKIKLSATSQKLSELSRNQTSTILPEQGPEQATIDETLFRTNQGQLTTSFRGLITQAQEITVNGVSSDSNKSNDSSHDSDIDSQLAESSAVKPQKKALFERMGDFVNELMPYAVEAAKKLNLDPRILVAQAALETGWGKYIMHDSQGQPGFNLFGIKSNNNWQGESIEINTLEVEDQAFKKVNAKFRKYESFAESFKDYVDFIISNPRYEQAVNSTEDASNYVKALQDSGYATDPDYADKILRIFGDQRFQNATVGFK
ncbi:flagellar assembly peptidoglycan hydrolase FlgJ [Aliikangiella marina]|uniref:Peptidoglycan hydrolase FlgJ n=1 Tax=Aliikangiella marina TaxID=1712262 RepID=A0A545TDM7_9GAMM|nr:flagellar assembly peptidoglycan hydrolase FlgJ [Aliikangiella marina]TQV75310.1 flagellar assembly peptidoglycan hydrolase FlgJ [Aliikangiella marina]